MTTLFGDEISLQSNPDVYLFIPNHVSIRQLVGRHGMKEEIEGRPKKHSCDNIKRMAGLNWIAARENRRNWSNKSKGV